MYLVVRGMFLGFMVGLIVAASTFASGRVATYTAEQGLNENLRLFLTGLAGVMAALIFGAFLLLLGFFGNRE